MYVHELQFASEHIKSLYCSVTVRLLAMTDIYRVGNLRVNGL